MLAVWAAYFYSLFRKQLGPPLLELVCNGLLVLGLLALGVAGCGEVAKLPEDAGMGPQPTLPSPNRTLIREAAGLLMSAAKRLSVPIFLIGHITKEGTIVSFTFSQRPSRQVGMPLAAKSLPVAGSSGVPGGRARTR